MEKVKMMGKAAAAAAAKKKGQRSSRNHRPPRPDPSPSRPPPRPPPPQTESRRSLRPRRRRLSIADYDEESEEEERGRRKLKLVLNLPLIPAATEERPSKSPPIYPSPKPVPDAAPVSAHLPPSASTSSPSASSTSFSSLVDEDAVKPLKKRRINGYDDGVGSDGSGHQKERKKNGVSRSKGSVSGTSPEPPKGTPLPERKTLEPILDKLQKKDVYRVFARPVDPEELPDYYDLIEHPMDFGTIRKKLASNAYRSFEQFEDDVFLICSNAMHYNAPDTVYFRQARAIQDMARKNFQILRAEVKCVETERKSGEKTKFCIMEKKSVPKSLCRTEQKLLVSDISSGATLASDGDTCIRLGTVQANGVEKPAAANVLVDGNSSLGESKSEKACLVDGHSSEKAGLVEGISSLGDSKSEKAGFAEGNSSLGESKSEKADDLSVKCSPSKIMQKPFLVDVNRRATYNKSEPQLIIESDSVLDVFESETKQLIDVGLHAENSYARSLAHFAALLGPIGWKIASKEIEKALPPGIKFGPGWVGEYEPLPTPVLSLENRNLNSNLKSKITPREDKESEARSEVTQGGESKVMQLCLKSQVTTGMSDRASNTGEGTLFGRTTSGKQGILGVSAETQPKTANPKDQVAIHFSKASNNIPGQVRVCDSSSVSSTPVETALRRTGCHSADAQPRIMNAMLQHQNGHVSIDYARSYSNNTSEQAKVCNPSSVSCIPVETALRRPEFHSEARRQGLFCFSTETQPRIINAMLPQQQKDQVAIDFTKVCSNVPEQARGCYSSSVSSSPVETAVRKPECHSAAWKQKDRVAIDLAKDSNNVSEQYRVCNSSSVSSNTVEATLQRPKSRSEAQNQGWFSISSETQPRISNAMPQHQKDRVPINFANVYSNLSEQFGASVGSIPVETPAQRTDCRSEAADSRSSGMIPRNRNQVPHEPRKQPAAVTSQCGSDALGLTVGGSASNNNNNRGNTSLEYISNSQSGAAGYFLTHGSHEQAIDFRLMGLGLPGMNPNQPNNSNAGIYTVKQVMPQLAPPRRGDANASDARPWMPYGPESRSFDAMANTFHSAGWRAPTTAAMVHGDSKISPMSRALPQPTPLVAEGSQGQNGVVFYPQLVAADLSRFRGRSPWQGLVPHSQPRQKDMLPPDLNIGFQQPVSPARPSSGVLVDSQQPDLALQL